MMVPDYDDDIGDYTPSKKLARTKLRSSSRSNIEDIGTKLTKENGPAKIVEYEGDLTVKKHELGGKLSNKKDEKLIDDLNFETTIHQTFLHPTEGAPRHHRSPSKSPPQNLINHRSQPYHQIKSKFSIKDELQDKGTGAQ